MELFDKAQDLLDKAQEKMADATTLAAWKANQTVRIKAVQARKEEVEKQIEDTTLKLGNRVYQLWKNRGNRDDHALEELCHTLDDLLSRYREVNAELSEVSKATYGGVAVAPRSAGPAGTATVLPAGSGGAPVAQILPPSPPRQNPAPTTPPPRAARTTTPPAPQPDTPDQQTPQPAPQPAPATQAPQRTTAKPKPCPSCGTIVPADETYCPRCGYMAR
jgi:zinc-ribbon domain